MPFSIPQAIISSLCYADVFSYPLTFDELFKFLIAPKSIPKSVLNKELALVIRSGKIGSREVVLANHKKPTKLYFLSGHSKIVNLRINRQKISAKKAKIAQRVGEWLKIIPTIDAIFVTGALAMNNCRYDDDIDFMIITKKNSLWITRIIITIILTFTGFKRPFKANRHKANNKICTNLYLDNSELGLSAMSQNLYTAHEVVQAKPLWTRRETAERFLTTNSWVRNFLPHTPLVNRKLTTTPMVANILVATINQLSFQLQRIYMHSKITSERVTLHTAFFHPRKTAIIIDHAFQARLTSFL
jgi:hypothetical protein